MAYLLFDADRKFFDNGEGDSVSLGSHLGYLELFGGTPDCWEIVDTENPRIAVKAARESNMHLYVIDDSSYRVVAELNKVEGIAA